jgi:leucyl aminopeptidase
MDANGGIELTLLQGAPQEAHVDLFAFTTFGDPSKDSFFKSVDSALNGVLSDVAKSESFEGKSGQSIVVHTHGRIPAKRILVVGAGGRSEFANPHIRDIAASVAQAANKASAASVGFLLPALGANREHALVQVVAEGVHLGTYKFGRYFTGEDHKRPMALRSFGVFLDPKGKKPNAAQARAFTTAVTRGTQIAQAVNHARDLINEPAAAITPVALAGDAQAIAKKHKTITVTVLDAKKCQELGMGMFLAVGRGSDQEPRFIHMIYKPAKKPKKRLCFIGKGITCDEKTKTNQRGSMDLRNMDAGGESPSSLDEEEAGREFIRNLRRNRRRSSGWRAPETKRKASP